MIVLDDIRKKALMLWQSPHFLRAMVEGHSIFPWEIAFPKLRGNALSGEYAAMKEWLRVLQSQSKQAIGYGYSVDYMEVNHRLLGKQSLPQRIFIESGEDFLRLINKQKECARFNRQVAIILNEYPQLKEFIAKQPHMVLDNVDRWEFLLTVCRYFVLHPRPFIYLRQLDIPGVDTKFIETNKKILADLLDIILSEDAKDTIIKSLSDHGFERRFGLRYEAPLIRFRLLDATLSIAGLTDITLPLPDFQQLKLPIRRVFITENKVNGLCFPDCPNSLVVFGLGYGIGMLANVDWLKNVEIYYWGDIDTHGFAILDRLREFFPTTHSFLMDENTLNSFKTLWVKEAPQQRFNGQLTRLTEKEHNLFNNLRDNTQGQSIRLEQERITYTHLQTNLAALPGE